MLFKVILLSIIEGVTEFLPISSTAHLILVSEWLKLPPSFYEVFDVVIQMGSIFAVICLFPQEFKSVIQPSSHHARWRLAMAIMPILVIGFMGRHFIKDVLFSPMVIFVGLIVGGVALIIADRKALSADQNNHQNSITVKQSFFIGCWQCLALWPGMSRSAMTMIGGLASGLNRTTAASFSFFIAVPVLMVVGIYDLIRSITMLSLQELIWILIGCLISFLVSYATMRWFLKLIKHKGLSIFGVYRIIVGTIGLVIYL